MFHDPDTQQRSISWNTTNPKSTLRRRSLWWMIRIAREFGIISAALEAELDWLRTPQHGSSAGALGHRQDGIPEPVEAGIRHGDENDPPNEEMEDDLSMTFGSAQVGIAGE